MPKIHTGEFTDLLKRLFGMRGEFSPELVPVMQPMLSIGRADWPAPFGIPWAGMYTVAAVAATRAALVIDTRQTGKYQIRIDLIRRVAGNGQNINVSLARDLQALATFTRTSCTALDFGRIQESTTGSQTFQGAALGFPSAGNDTGVNLQTKSTQFWTLTTDGEEFTQPIYLLGKDARGDGILLWSGADNTAITVGVAGVAFPAP